MYSVDKRVKQYCLEKIVILFLLTSSCNNLACSRGDHHRA
jgi:hypothetical protein